MLLHIAASGPTIPPRGIVPPDPNATHLFFSGNWAAVIGVIMCWILLFSWFHYKIKALDDAAKDKSPGKQKNPDEGP